MRYLLVLLPAAMLQAQMLTAIVGGNPAASSGVIDHVYVSSNTSCATGTTCAVTLANGLPAGGDAVVVANVASMVKMTSTSADGTGSQEILVRGIAQGNRGNLYAYRVKNASAIASAGTLTVNWVATNGGGKVWVFDVRAAAGSPALDIDAYADMASNSGVTPSSIPGVSLALSSNPAVVIQAVNVFGSTSTVASAASPWNTNFATSGNTAVSYVSGVSSFTAPTWTAHSSVTIYSVIGVAIGFSPTPCDVGAYVDWSGGTVGSDPTVATLAASVKGLPGRSNPAITSLAPYYWTLSNVSGYLAYASYSSPARSTAPTRLCYGGEAVPTFTQGLQYTQSGASLNHSVALYMPSVDQTNSTLATREVASTILDTTFTGADAINSDWNPLFSHGTGSGSLMFANPQLGKSGSNLVISLEGPSTSISAASWSGGTVSATVAATTTFVSGATYTVRGISPSGYNANVAVTVVDATHITYPLASDPGSYSSGGTLVASVPITVPAVVDTLVEKGVSNCVYVRDLSGAQQGYTMCTPAQNSATYTIGHQVFGAATNNGNTAGRTITIGRSYRCYGDSTVCPFPAGM